MNEQIMEFSKELYNRLKARVRGYVNVRSKEGDILVVEIRNRGLSFKYEMPDISNYLYIGGSVVDLAKMIQGKYDSFIKNRFFKTLQKPKYRTFKTHFPISDPAGYYEVEESEDEEVKEIVEEADDENTDL